MEEDTWEALEEALNAKFYKGERRKRNDPTFSLNDLLYGRLTSEFDISSKWMERLSYGQINEEDADSDSRWEKICGEDEFDEGADNARKYDHMSVMPSFLENCEEPPVRRFFTETSFESNVEVEHPNQLHYAVRKNDIGCVQTILQPLGYQRVSEKNFVDLPGGDGLTVLQVAAMSGYKEIVQMLLKAGADTRLGGSFNDTPLHFALLRGKVHVAEVLIDWDSDKMPNNLQDGSGCTPLYLAARRGHTEIVKKLVASGANTRLPNADGETPLHAAIKFEKVDTAEALIDAGAANDLQNRSGSSPLHLAASKGFSGLCSKLLAAGCSPRLQDNRGATPLHIAINGGKEDVASLLLSWDGGNSFQNFLGMTPLHSASSRGYVRIVEKLLSGYANTNLQNIHGHTPLRIAVEDGHEEIAEILISSGSENGIRCEHEKKTPLHIAAMLGRERVVRKLLFHDVHPHTKDKIGGYPLKSALGCGNNKIVQMILSACSVKGVAIDYTKLDLKSSEIQSCIEFQSKCEAEVVEMKSIIVPGTTVSYHDLAKRNINKVARYLDNELIQLYCDTTILSMYSKTELKDFPIYAELIAFKVARAKERKFLMHQCMDYFVLLSEQLPSLPILVIDIILLCLCERDLKKFVDSFEFQPQKIFEEHSKSTKIKPFRRVTTPQGNLKKQGKYRELKNQQKNRENPGNFENFFKNLESADNFTYFQQFKLPK